MLREQVWMILSLAVHILLLILFFVRYREKSAFFGLAIGMIVVCLLADLLGIGMQMDWDWLRSIDRNKMLNGIRVLSSLSWFLYVYMLCCFEDMDKSAQKNPKNRNSSKQTFLKDADRFWLITEIPQFLNEGFNSLHTHAIDCFPIASGCHVAGFCLDTLIRQQIKCRIVQVPIEPLIVVIFACCF